MTDRQETIMVVDDTPANLQVLQKVLLDSGYRVVAFPAGRLALSAAARNPPDLILLDINMPEMTGFEVCERLKSDGRLREIPVIFISALTETSEKVRAFTLGGVDYVTKPFQVEEVRARVRTHLSLRAARRELEKQNEILQENVRLREFVDQVSRHDLKGPLTAFLNVPEMLRRSGNLLPNQVELLDLLTSSARRLMEMVHRSLDLDKMERGDYRLNPVPVDVVKVVKEVFQTHEGLLARKELAWTVLLGSRPVGSGDLLELPGEEFLFFSLLSNLIKNAIEASPPGQEIAVFLSGSGAPTIAVQNQGCIPSQIRERLFQRYVTFGKERGTGLGLYAARLMARTLGGDLSFTTSETDGTRFVLTLASVRGSEKSPGSPGGEAGNHGSR